eukprot:scaffold207145_cov16-Tisochrysis_lutea.AAC.1
MQRPMVQFKGLAGMPCVPACLWPPALDRHLEPLPARFFPSVFRFLISACSFVGHGSLYLEPSEQTALQTSKTEKAHRQWRPTYTCQRK